MTDRPELCEVVITAPDADWLLDLTRQLVTEGRASLHTRLSRVNEIVTRVKASHPYEVPGISARPIVSGNPDYLAWIAAETKGDRIES